MQHRSQVKLYGVKLHGIQMSIFPAQVILSTTQLFKSGWRRLGIKSLGQSGSGFMLKFMPKNL